VNKKPIKNQPTDQLAKKLLINLKELGKPI